MSACIVLFRESAFGKRVIAALNDRLSKMPPAESQPETVPDGESQVQDKPADAEPGEN